MSSYEVTQAQLAEILGCSPRHLRNLEAAGMPCRLEARTKLYDLVEVIPWVREWDRRNVAESRGGWGG